MTEIIIHKSLAVRMHGCYEPEKVAALFGDRDSMTAREWCDRVDIPIQDRIWALCHWGILSDSALRLHACYHAEQALLAVRSTVRKPDVRLWNATTIARKFAVGNATREELVAAWAAAWDASVTTMGVVARAAARAAARTATATASETTEWTIARSAARSAVQTRQLECFKIQIKLDETKL